MHWANRGGKRKRRKRVEFGFLVMESSSICTLPFVGIVLGHFLVSYKTRYVIRITRHTNFIYFPVSAIIY